MRYGDAVDVDAIAFSGLLLTTLNSDSATLACGMVLEVGGMMYDAAALR